MSKISLIWNSLCLFEEFAKLPQLSKYIKNEGLCCQITSQVLENSSSMYFLYYTEHFQFLAVKLSTETTVKSCYTFCFENWDLRT